jgi:hypothetical protein
MDARSRFIATSIVGAVVCCCSGPDQPADGGLDAEPAGDSGSDALSRDSGGDARGPDAVVIDAREGLPDAPFDDALWERIPGLAAECNIRVARDPAAVLGEWRFGACGDAVAGCLAVRRSGFSRDLPDQIHIVDVSEGRFGVTLSERIAGGRHTDYLQFTREGAPEIFLRNVYPSGPRTNCNFTDADVEASHSFLYFTDMRMSDSDLNGAAFPILAFRDGAWSLHATLEYDVLRNAPQNAASSDVLIANLVAPSNRMLTVLNDGTYFFTAPAPPFEATRIHSTPSVVGENWVATGLMGSTANGLFMSHRGEPSIRIRDVDAVGEVVANETDIVWLEGSRLTEGIRLDGTTLWRAPWRPGPIDPDEARIVRPIEDVARIYPDVLNLSSGSARLERALARRHAEVLGLLHAVQLGELHAELAEVQRGDLLVELLRQHVDLADSYSPLLGPERDLREHLVGEAAAHHEAGVTRGAAEVHQAAAREDDEALAVGEDEVIDLRLDVLFLDEGLSRGSRSGSRCRSGRCCRGWPRPSCAHVLA